MPFATGFVPTSRAQRYIKQLVSHFGNKVSTELTDSGGLIEFDFGRCALETTADGIQLVASADSAEQVTTVQDVVARHLERFGAAEDLRVAWRAD